MEGLFQVMPPLSAEEYAELKADIQARGVMVPIEYDEAGAVLDGHHRLKACTELGLKEWPSVVRLGMDEAAKRTHARKLNMARRHLNQEQRRGLIQAELKENPEKSNRQIADELKVSDHTVKAVRDDLESTAQIAQLTQTIGKDGKNRVIQEKITRTKRGRPRKIISIPVANPAQVVRMAAKGQAVLEASKDKPELQKVVDQMANSGKVNSAAKQVAKIQAAEAINAEPLPLPTGPFRVIVADPPWLYGNRADDVSHRSANPYPSMTIEDICALPVADFAHDDCILWLWTTNAHMRESYAVLDAWGFQSKTILTWVKDRIGTGDWLRGQTEHCHLAIRGKPTILTTGQGTVLHGPLQAHSQKPDSFYALVDAICPGAKLEMFCRSPREGWSAWGNEAGESV